MTITELLSLPQPNLVGTIQVVAGIIGALLHVYGVFIEKENKRDLIFALGGALLFAYSLIERNLIFMLAFGVFTIGSAYEAIQIARGKHIH